ncbi:hypothetical protein WJX73_006821 [Symbiochloris irregularis]|uniref:Uncharacterized protein n=1 Tax=Symbiochloris irregularis TaxID=706552 RepID=A0AAW1P7U9_9CHLO
MCEDDIKLTRTRGLAVDPCNVDGRLLAARIEAHLYASPQPDAWQAAELEHAKFLQRKYQEEERTLKHNEALTQRLQACSRTKPRKQQEIQQAMHAATQRKQLQEFNQGVSLRNKSRTRSQQLTVQAASAAGPVPRLSRSSPRRSRSRTSSRILMNLTSSVGAQALGQSALGRASYSLRRGQWLQTSCRSMSPDQRCPPMPADDLSVTASSLQIHCRTDKAAGQAPLASGTGGRPAASRLAPKMKGVSRAQGNAARLANLAWKVRTPSSTVCVSVASV